MFKNIMFFNQHALYAYQGCFVPKCMGLMEAPGYYPSSTQHTMASMLSRPG